MRVGPISNANYQNKFNSITIIAKYRGTRKMAKHHFLKKLSTVDFMENQTLPSHK